MNETQDKWMALTGEQFSQPTLFMLAYEIGGERADQLYRKAISDQWHIDEQTDWNQTIDPSSALIGADKDSFLRQPVFSGLSQTQKDTFFAHYAMEKLSQLLHGEQGALLVASQLVKSVPDMDGKLFASSQVMDEARHVDTFSRYIQRMRETAPPCPTIKRVLNKILCAPNWQSQLVGMQIIVEGLALSSFVELRKQTHCPVLLDLLNAIIRDEARHVAFGGVSLRSSIDLLTETEQVELEDFVFDLVMEYRHWGRHNEDWMGLISAMVIAGIDPTDYLNGLKSLLVDGEHVQFSPSMAYAMDKMIMPGLGRLGLIPERLLASYQRNSVSVSEDLSLINEIEAYITQ